MQLIDCEMTSKERLIEYAKGNEVDRIPVTLTASETLPCLYGLSIADCYFSADLMVLVERRLAADFGIDNMGMGLGLRTIVEAYGTKMKYQADAVAIIKEPFLKEYSMLDHMDMLNLEKDGRFPILIEAFQQLTAEFGDQKIISTGIGGPLTTAVNFRGAEQFLRDSVKRKEDVHRLLRFTTDVIIQCIKDLHQKLGISVSISEPMAAGDVISLRQFRELEKPYLAEVAEAVQRIQGKPPGVHICGKTYDRWQDICETGVGSFSIDNCEDMSVLKETHGHKIGIVGNLPPVDILKNGTVAEIEAGVMECIRQAGDNEKGFTLCPGCTTPVHTPKENLIAYMNAAYTYGRRARMGQMPAGMEGL